MSEESPTIVRKFYFVDESGDATLFSRTGQVIVGQAGCSKIFALGLLEVPDPVSLSTELVRLRQGLLSDPYFRNVPSFDPRHKKTAIAFHAKDDLPEVRREVYSLLRSHPGLCFYAVLRDKSEVVKYVRNREISNSTYRYHPNELYDSLVQRLTKNLLHKADEYQVCFARRGNKTRTEALHKALLAARNRFDRQWKRESISAIHVLDRTPEISPCLQAVDYFLWALQRLFLHQEERYWASIWPACKLVMDMDDRRQNKYGKYYNQKKPLDLAALDGRYF